MESRLILSFKKRHLKRHDGLFFDWFFNESEEKMESDMQQELIFDKKMCRRGWYEMLEELPTGWKRIPEKLCGTHEPGYEYAHNGIGLLSPNIHLRKKALVRIIYSNDNSHDKEPPTPINKNNHKNSQKKLKKFNFCAKTAKKMNELARLKKKESILKDIYTDLIICEVEGWDKKEYINDLKTLINSISP